MKKLRNRKKSGFTLIEVVIAIALGAFVSAMMLTVATPGLRHIQTIKNAENLHLNALFLSNTFSCWIKQGESITVFPPSSLEIKLPDSSIKTVTWAGDSIMVNGSPFTTNNIEVTNLTFTSMERSVRIDFTIKANGTEETLSVNTTVAQRNSL